MFCRRDTHIRYLLTAHRLHDTIFIFLSLILEHLEKKLDHKSVFTLHMPSSPFVFMFFLLEYTLSYSYGDFSCCEVWSLRPWVWISNHGNRRSDWLFLPALHMLCPFTIVMWTLSFTNIKYDIKLDYAFLQLYFI